MSAAFPRSFWKKEKYKANNFGFVSMLFAVHVEGMAGTKEMAFKKDNSRRNIRHRSEKAATTTHRNQYRNRSEERHCWRRNWNWRSSKTSTNRWHTTARSFGEMRRSEDDPTDLHTLRTGSGELLDILFSYGSRSPR